MLKAMVQELTAESYEAFIREKRAAAVHFDAEWDVGYRPITRRKMQEAEAALSEQANFGEVDCDREIPLAKSVGLIGVPAVAYYLDGILGAVLPGVRQESRTRSCNLEDHTFLNNSARGTSVFRFD